MLLLFQEWLIHVTGDHIGVHEQEIFKIYVH